MSLSKIERHRLSVLLDIRQPQAYLALQPAAWLAAECAIEINWLPVVVPPLKAPSEPAVGDDRGVRHRRIRSQAVAREIATYADAQGLLIEEYYRDGDPGPFNLSWLWVRQRHPAHLFDYLREAFRAYWALELDVADDRAVAGLLERCGVGGPQFDSWKRDAGVGIASGLAEELRERGVSRAPAYLIEDELFIGRQHLPMIRWILGGRRGRGAL
jgi:2-hydroxychromene-2-carboxylate isomerase